MKSILFIFLLSFLILACSNPSKQGIEVLLKSDIKKESKSFKKENVTLPKEFIFAKSFYVYQDSILIVLNKKYENIPFLEFYNLVTNDSIGEYIPYGNGPNEMLYAGIKIYDNLLVVNDIVKKQVAFINLDSILTSQHYTIKMQKYGTYTYDVVPYINGELLMENLNCFQNQELDINYNISRFIVADKNYDYSKEDKYEYYVKNATGGCIIPQYAKDRIIYAASNRPLIEIYNNNLEIIKSIAGPDKIPPKFIIIDNEVVFKSAIPYAYLEHCNDKEFFYVTYMGNYFKPNTKMYDYPLWLFKFDWDGNFIDNYSIGEYVESISLGANGKHFYATGYDEEKNPILIKLTPQ